MGPRSIVRGWLPLLLAVGTMLLAGCAAGPNPLIDTPAPDGVIAGFWRGLWHGCIFPITFVLSLFTDSVSVYELHNNGGWYDVGFILGIATSMGGGSHGARHGVRRRRVTVTVRS